MGQNLILISAKEVRMVHRANIMFTAIDDGVFSSSSEEEGRFSQGGTNCDASSDSISEVNILS